MPASRRDRTDDGFYLLADPVKNLRIEHIVEVEVSTSVTRSGKRIGCRPIFEARLAEAYARQGVPRPSPV